MADEQYAGYKVGVILEMESISDKLSLLTINIGADEYAATVRCALVLLVRRAHRSLPGVGACASAAAPARAIAKVRHPSSIHHAPPKPKVARVSV